MARVKAALLFLAAALLVASGARPLAHKAVTSKYTYNQHVLPILRDRCGSCHADGGPTPMSLLTYKDALPWAQSIREELASERMPPWFVDPAGPPVEHGRAISSQEIDVVLTWATGGTPEGPPLPASEASSPTPLWRDGPPHLRLSMDAAHVLPAEVNEEVVDVSFATNLAEGKWLKGADLMPGSASMVRDAQISIENGPVLAAWLPGGDGVTTPDDAAFRLEPGARIHLRIHYRKRWQDERTPQSDRSEVGLYFSDRREAHRAIQTLAIDGSPVSQPGALTIGATLETAARVLAVRPSFDRPYGLVEVNAIEPSGKKVPLLKLRGGRPEWRRRYWLSEAAGLPAGSRIEVTLAPPAVAVEDPRTSTGSPLQVALEYVAR